MEFQKPHVHNAQHVTAITIMALTCNDKYNENGEPWFTILVICNVFHNPDNM